MLRVYREYERRKADQGYVDFEDLIELAIRLFDADEGALDAGARPLSGVHGRRVPGRQPAPADAARPLARRPRRAVRGRRRLPVDLRLHGREPRAPARDAEAVPARDGRSGSRRTTARRPRCSSSRTGSCRGSAAPRRCCGRRGRRAPSRSRARSATPELEAAFVVERIRELHDEGVPYEEMAILFRTNARSADYEEALERGRHPVAGRGAPRTRCAPSSS